MRIKYLERIKQGVVLFDGAMGTMLYQKGVFINRCFEEINLSSPQMVSEIHGANVEAGAQVLTTNSYGANPLKLKGYNLADKTAEINKKAAFLAREVAGDDLYVAGSVGPLGGELAPTGKITIEEAENAYEVQLKALIEGGVDLILLETYKNVDELLLAAKVARRVDGHIPIQGQVKFHYQDGGVDKLLITDAVRRLNEAVEIDIIGTNCGIGPAPMLDVLIEMRKEAKKPISVVPDAGIPKEIEGRQLYLASPDYFAEYAMRFQDAGASIIGGCCGTTPEHIQKMGKAVLNLASGRKNIIMKSAAADVEYKEEIPLSERSDLGKALAERRWISSIELVPPIGADLTKTIEKTAALKEGGAEFINLPDGPRASSRISAMVTSLELEKQTGVETILHICCRDRNLLAMQGDLLGAQAAGLRNMLLVTGDPPKEGNYPDVTGVFDVDSIGLLKLGKRLNQGVDLGGNSLPAVNSLVLGAGANTASPALEQEIERAYEKAEAGAEFFITQPVFDVEGLISFLDRIKGTNVPVLVGVWPLASYRNALFLNNEVPGVVIPDSVMERMEVPADKEAARQEGILIARETVDAVRSQVAGIQVSPPFGNVKTALEVVK